MSDRIRRRSLHTAAPEDDDEEEEEEEGEEEEGEYDGVAVVAVGAVGDVV